jgi:2,4-dienoyl-CoA reductase (NADPH2)
MHTGLEEPGMFGGLEEMAEFYAERARGEVGLIVTGGISPNKAGVAFLGGSKMTSASESKDHKVVTQAVHEAGGLIAMQILHTGRYGYHYWTHSASAIKAPIGWSTPKALSSAEVLQSIDDFAKCAVLAKEAGYDGVEIMGSEGYFINQFLTTRTNKRDDEWGGPWGNRMRLPVEIVKAVRAAVGKDFIIIYRLSMLDLVDEGHSWPEVVELAQAIEGEGANIINTGIGWHEARIPTIATMVPRGAFTWVTKKLKKDAGLTIPLCTTNRINMPAVAEDVLAHDGADIISMARPLLADPDFMRKTRENRVDEINTCIGCNQACLDHIFKGKRASCLVNPRAAYETSLQINPVEVMRREKIAVVGAGPAGLAFAVTAAQRGHSVTLFEKDSRIGGQFNMAKMIPGKNEFNETLRYFQKQIELTNVDLRLGATSSTHSLLRGFDAVVIATGVNPRNVAIPKNFSDQNEPEPVKILTYIDVLRNGAAVGESVAIIGAGGIGYDVAEFLSHNCDGDENHRKTHEVPPPPYINEEEVATFLDEWNIDQEIKNAGGLKERSSKKETVSASGGRQIYLCQRKEGKLGMGLGKTTGWIHRTTLKEKNVKELDGCQYIEVNDEGLVVERKGKRETLKVDTVVLCAGQEKNDALYQQLEKTLSGSAVDARVETKLYLLGGALEAGELDAKRAIDQAVRLASQIENASAGQVFDAPITLTTKIVDILAKFSGR